MPIGSIYLSLTTDNPTNLFGGTWERIKDTFLLATGDTYTLGETGGAPTVTLSTANMPAHTHTRGTMDITGTVAFDPLTAWTRATRLTGAFYEGSDRNARLSGGSQADESVCTTAAFQASRAWTGKTSSEGEGVAFSNMPPYLAVYVWKRIS